jgi:hypothetical protein
MLALAEDALRYNQAASAAIDLTTTRGAGTNGPICRGNLHAKSRGVEDWHTKERATWPQLLRALRAQREAEPRVAQARDLAEAYHCLHSYAHVYGTPADLPPTLLASIHAQIVALGGRPRRRRPHPLIRPLRPRASRSRPDVEDPDRSARRRGTRPVSPATARRVAQAAAAP